jgi:hypothetical protein
MPSLLRLTHHFTRTTETTRTSAGRIGAGGKPRERSAGRLSDLPTHFEYISTAHVPTHTSYPGSSSEFSSHRVPAPARASSALSSPAKPAHSLTQSNHHHRQHSRSQIASLSLNPPHHSRALSARSHTRTPKGNLCTHERRFSARSALAAVRFPAAQALYCGHRLPTAHQRARTRSTRAPTAPETLRPHPTSE